MICAEASDAPPKRPTAATAATAATFAALLKVFPTTAFILSRDPLARFASGYHRSRSIEASIAGCFRRPCTPFAFSRRAARRLTSAAVVDAPHTPGPPAARHGHHPLLGYALVWAAVACWALNATVSKVLLES